MKVCKIEKGKRKPRKEKKKENRDEGEITLASFPFYSNYSHEYSERVGASRRCKVGDAGQKQNAKADQRCLPVIGGEWDAFLAKMQMQVGKAPILAQNPTAAAPEHEGTLPPPVFAT